MAEEEIWATLCGKDETVVRPRHDGDRGVEQEALTEDYLPILVGGLFDNALFTTLGVTGPVRTSDLPSLLRRIGTSHGSREELLLRWRSCEAAIDCGTNFEVRSFLTLLHRFLPSAPHEPQTPSGDQHFNGSARGRVKLTTGISLQHHTSPTVTQTASEYTRTIHLQRSDLTVERSESRLPELHLQSEAVLDASIVTNEAPPIEAQAMSAIETFTRSHIESHLEGRNVLSRYEYIPSIVIIDEVDVDEVDHNLEYKSSWFLVLSITFPFDYSWRVKAEVRIELPPHETVRAARSILDFNVSHLNRGQSPCSNSWHCQDLNPDAVMRPRSPRGAFPPIKSRTTPPVEGMTVGEILERGEMEELDSMVGALSSIGVYQYRLDLKYDGKGESLYRELERPLAVVIKDTARSKAFFQANHLFIAWDKLRPFVEQVDRRLAGQYSEMISRGELVLGQLSPQVRTASNATLSELYLHLPLGSSQAKARDPDNDGRRERPFFYTPKLNGEQSKVFITISRGGHQRDRPPSLATSSATQTKDSVWNSLSFFEALALKGTIRNWSLSAEEIGLLMENGMSDEETVQFIYDAEYVGDVYYIVRALVVGNVNYMNRPEEESWVVILGPLTSALSTLLRGRGVTLDRNEPRLLTRSSFKELLSFDEDVLNGVPIDGLILTQTMAPYFNLQGEDVVHMRYKLKPPRHNSLDLLLKRVSMEALISQGVPPPKGTLSTYIAYTTGSHKLAVSSPIQKLRSGMWRMAHFPSLSRFDRGQMPCEFMTTILPSSHVAVVSDPEDMMDYNDKIVECILVDGWLRPQLVREAKTVAYKSGIKSYGNGYRVAVSMLPSILDPVTVESLSSIISDADCRLRCHTNPGLYPETNRGPDNAGGSCDISRATSTADRRYYRDYTTALSIGRAVVYGVYLESRPQSQARPTLEPRTLGWPQQSRGLDSGLWNARETVQRSGQDDSEHRGRAKRVASTGTIVEIGCDSSDIPRVYCSGARTVYIVDEDVHSLLRYESAAFNLGSQSRSRTSPAFVYPISTFSIPTVPIWNLRTVHCSMEMEEDLTRELRSDNLFPANGVASITFHDVLHKISWREKASAMRVRRICDSLLGMSGVVSFIYKDGSLINSLFRNDLPRPWVKGSRGIELNHNDAELLGRTKYYISPYPSSLAKTELEPPVLSGPRVSSSHPVERVSVLSFPLDGSSEGKERVEYLVSPTVLVSLFLPEYTVLYDGPMIQEPHFLSSLKESGAIPVSNTLEDTFVPVDFNYLSLYRLTVLRKVGHGGRGTASRMFSEVLSSK